MDAISTLAYLSYSADAKTHRKIGNPSSEKRFSHAPVSGAVPAAMPSPPTERRRTPLLRLRRRFASTRTCGHCNLACGFRLKRMWRHAGKRCNARSSPTRMSSYSINRSATLPQFSWRNKWWACVGREERGRVEEGEEGRGGRGVESRTHLESRMLSLEYSLYKPSVAG